MNYYQEFDRNKCPARNECENPKECKQWFACVDEVTEDRRYADRNYGGDMEAYRHDLNLPIYHDPDR